MNRILCWLGWHRWSCYATESDAVSMIFESHCLRCSRRKETRAGAPASRPELATEYWSHRAEARRRAGMPDTGEMWQYGHVRPLDAEEYEHWMTHGLPYGWSITRLPDELWEKR